MPDQLTNNSEDFEEKNTEKEIKIIKRFYSQINSVPQLINQAQFIDHFLNKKFNEIQLSASQIVQQLNQRKKQILNNFDQWLLPAAKEALDELTEDAEELHLELKEALKDLEHSNQMDWTECARRWAHLYAKWYDHKDLTDKVLKMVALRTSQLIEKDIQMVQDYQNQSLAQMHHQSEEVQKLEARLKRATVDSLKALNRLKSSPDELSLKQASEWMAKIHQERGMHLDEVLVKIDSIMRDVVQEETYQDTSYFLELEGELAFMEHELHDLKRLFPHLKRECEDNRQYVKDRLNELTEHLEQFNLSSIPYEIRLKLESIQAQMAYIEKQLTSL